MEQAFPGRLVSIIGPEMYRKEKVGTAPSAWIVEQDEEDNVKSVLRLLKENA